MYDEMNLDSLFCMLKGEPGTRKSTQALSFPKPQYWFSHDKKMRSIGIPMMNWGINPSQISFDNYTDYAAMETKIKQFTLNCSFKTLVIDTITSSVDSILWQTKREKQGKTRQSGQEAGIKIAGILVNELEDYKAEDAALSDMMRMLKDIHEYHKINIVIVAHVILTAFKDNKTNQTHLCRNIVTAGKQIAQKIPAYCDEVYHFNIAGTIDTSQEGTYECLTRHTGDDYARTTLPLATKIQFGNEPLYDKYVLPAIQQQKEQIKKYKEQNQPQSTQQNITVKQA